MTPSCSGDTVSVNEDDVLSDAVSCQDVEAGDTFDVVDDVADGQLSLDPNDGSYTYTPDGDFNGGDGFTFRVLDPDADSTTTSVDITVDPVNDAPSFTKGPDQTVPENAGPQSKPGWATNISKGPSDESGQTVSFQITGNTNAGLFSADPAVSSNGTLSYEPAASKSGSATITLHIEDNGGTGNGGDDTGPTRPSRSRSMMSTIRPALRRAPTRP